MASGASADLVRCPPGHDHIVQFYEGEGFLADVVVRFLAAGVDAGEPLVVIATPAHRAAFEAGLACRAIDVAGLVADRRLVFADARETLAAFMRGGAPDWTLFHDAIAGVLDALDAAAPGHRVRAYGEMVDLLWRDGNATAAVQLEEHWNEIGRLRRFSLLCAYVMGNFREAADGDGFDEVCRTHSHVLPSEGYLRHDENDARMREISMLQQRARALETEIERRKETERALVDAVRVRDDFLAVAGHELRTPLTAIQLHIQSLVRLPDHPARTRERLEKSLSQVERLGGLVESLLDVSRLTAGPLVPARGDVDLARLAREVIDRVAGSAARVGGTIRLVAGEPIEGRWDGPRLEQVLTNLLANAIRYGGGAPIEVIVSSDDRHAHLVVRDHGPGVAIEEQQRIFERFARASSARHFGGLGLGLWIVRQIVEAHGGEVSLESTPGQGAAFLVRLPLI